MERIALTCADCVDLDVAQKIWDSVESAVLNRLGNSSSAVFDVEGHTFLLMHKTQWESIEQFSHLVGKADFVVHVDDSSSDASEKLKASARNNGESKRLDRIKVLPGVVPPPGWIQAIIRDSDGTENKYWVDPYQLNHGEPTSELTVEQIKAIKSIHHCLSDVDNSPLDVWLYNFSCNEYPDREIGVFALIAKVIEQERPYRRGNELKDIYHVVVRLSCLGRDNMIGNLLSSMPEAKRIKNLERVVTRWENVLVN